MNRFENYFDNAATTPLDPRVLREMLPHLGAEFGNAHSLHSWGSRAAAAVELARQRVASLIECEDSSQITFTSGATEANNWVLASFADAVVSPFEHSSLFETAKAKGLEILNNDGLSLMPPGKSLGLLSIMLVNNEIGAMWEPSAYREWSSLQHSDITQAVGKLPSKVSDLDFASFSAHKFYGPKGIGALFSRSSAPEPMLHGGEQEEGQRAGTLNVPAIVGMGAAAAIAADELDRDLQSATAMRGAVLEGLTKLEGWQVNGGSSGSPYILSLSFHGLVGETIVIEMDRRGFGISSGAACSSRSTEPSHVLTALGMTPEWLTGTVRLSFGRFNTLEASAQLGSVLAETAKDLQKLQIR